MSESFILCCTKKALSSSHPNANFMGVFALWPVLRDHSIVFRKWPFLLTISTYRVGGSEKVQKPVYVIFEWSLTCAICSYDQSPL